MASVRVASAVFAMTVACGSTDTRYVPLPPAVAHAKSAIFLFHDPSTGDTAGAYAVTLDADGRVQAAVSHAVDAWRGDPPVVAQVYALYYELSLAELRVSAGPLARSSGDARRCEITTPFSVQAFLQTNGGWTSDTSPSAEIIDYLQANARDVCVPDLCVRLKGTSYPLGEPTNVETLLPIGPSRALIATSNGSFYETTPDGIMPRPDMTGMPFASAHCEESSTTCWFGGRANTVAFGPLDGPFTHLVLAGSRPRSIGAISGQGANAVTADLLIVAGLSGSGTVAPSVAVYTGKGSSIRRIYEANVDRVVENHLNVAWLAPGHALINYGGVNLLEVSGDTVTPLQVTEPDPLIFVGIQCIASHPDHGVLAGATSGRLYVRPNGGGPFAVLSEPQVFSAIEGAHVYRTGFVYGGLSGLVGQLHPGGRLCPPEDAGNSDVEEMDIAGDDLIISGGDVNDDGSNYVTWYVEER